MQIKDIITDIELNEEELKEVNGGWGYLLSSRWGGSRYTLPNTVFGNEMEEEEPTQMFWGF